MNQHVLVLNCGSSSIKFAIIDAKSGDTPLQGIAENLGATNGLLRYAFRQEKTIIELPDNASHKDALSNIGAVLNKFDELHSSLIAVGHRVVQGGEVFTHACLIDDTVKEQIRDLAKMAPLHNLAHVAGIESAQAAFPELPQVAVFDTAFFQTLPKHVYLYALPYSLYEQYGIRKFGFHGSSHYFVSREAAKRLNKNIEECNLITAHLGNGCSITAIKKGIAVDTSMGFTPLEGLVMGTRCGDIDPSIATYMIEQLDYSAAQVSSLMNKDSGLQGISQLTNDCRALEDEQAKGNEQAKLALDMFIYRLVKYIGSYLAVIGPLDALVFTGGIGENSSYIREQTIIQLGHLGLAIDDTLNSEIRFGRSGLISSKHSKPIYTIATNEEWVIAKETINYAFKA
ncbi:acetate kinase [Paraglaciecola sp. 20A4]|uniref:acetate kinase n=1 Tax=Paraglaciecola sp. 20A4 TaxID=2687288 RepID=UPI00140B8D3D|nr:acetate kinase [Paraglaciecola sp. 20A4]|tara:strand:- start:171 stop:1367 length:1197 start_codon:yes stop_codon:yes gene_type:complete